MGGWGGGGVRSIGWWCLYSFAKLAFMYLIFHINESMATSAWLYILQLSNAILVIDSFKKAGMCMTSDTIHPVYLSNELLVFIHLSALSAHFIKMKSI